MQDREDSKVKHLGRQSCERKHLNKLVRAMKFTTHVSLTKKAVDEVMVVVVIS